MSARHLTSSSSSSASRRRKLAVLAVVSALAIGTSGIALARASHDRAPRSAGPSCGHSVTLPVLATPAIAAPVSQLAADWNGEHHLVNGSCVEITVSSSADDVSEASVAIPTSGGPSLWIPDSTLWAQRLRTDLSRSPVPTASIQMYPSIASSPVVIAAPPSRAAQLAALGQAGLVKAAVSGTLPITVLDPLTHSEGLLSLLTMSRLFPGAPTSGADADRPARGLVSLMVRLSHTEYATPDLGFDDLAAGKNVLFAASEQAVIQKNRVSGRSVAGALYSPNSSYSLDYPVIRLSRTGDDPAVALAADEFQRRLRAIISQNTFASAGFRTPASTPIAAAGQLGSAPVKPLGQPAPAAAANMLRLWSATKSSSHTLAVIDVSGSMSEPAGNGETKINVAAAAAAHALKFFPDDFAFGLWSFSSNSAGGSPWTALAPVVPLGAEQDGVTQRTRLLAAAASLPARVGGNTALYDTTLAAFQQVRNTYDPAKINSVVLLTDGQNDYPAGISLDTLLTQLRSLADASRPVPVITIGVGDDADLPTLREISALTGGKTYAVKDPTQVADVFLDAMLQRQCRPTC